MSEQKPFVALVCGGRDYDNREAVYNALDALLRKKGSIHVVSGMAPGADASGHAWAQMNGQLCAEFRAKWNLHGNAAGPLRNKEMLEYLLKRKQQGAEIGVIAFPGGSGTAHMCKIAREYNIKIWEPVRG